MTFILGTFPRGVGMRKVDCAAPVLDLTERRKLRAVVHGNGLENLRELVSEFFPERLHGVQNGGCILAGNPDGNIVLRFLLQQGEDNSLFTGPLTDHGVTFPMTFLDAQSRNLGSLGGVRAEVLLAFTGLGVLVLLAFHGFGQFRHRQVEVARPDLIVKRVGADHLICRKQPVQTSIADAGIQRPLVFSDLLNYPANEPSAAADSVRFPRTFSVRLVDRFSTSCRVSGLPALAAPSGRCAAL